MNNPVAISTGGNVVLTEQSTIINGIVPNSISWTNQFTSYYIYNSTSSSIPSTPYYDAYGSLVTYIPSLTHLQVQSYTDGTWHVQTDSASQSNDGSIVYKLPIASDSILGGIKVGNNLQIESDGTLDAINGGQVQSDWNEGDNTQPDYIKNKPSIPSPYTLPAATTSVRGGVRPDGTTITISGDVISATGGVGGITQLTGDITAGPGSGSLPATLPNITTAGTYGDATHVPRFVLNAKGQVTSVSLVGISGLTATCMPKASDVGILANGTDQTTALNAIFANAAYAGIIMDYSNPAAVTISGTVNCQGKLIYYWPGNTFTGAGTLNAHVPAAGYNQKLWDTTITLTNTVCATDMFSAKWFGATGNGSTDDQPALQKSSDTVISNTTMTRDLYVPPGAYKIANPWIIYNWNGTTYGQTFINILGDYRVGMSTLSGIPRIIATFTDRPMIGFQVCTSGMFRGFSVEGPFVYNPPNGDTFVNTTFAAASGGAMRTSQFSPSCCLCYEPFTNGQQLAAGAGYPGMDGQAGSFNWYRGNNSNSGTTHHLISDCSIQGCTVGVMNTPNGFTQQGEDCRVQDCEFRYVNVALSYGQAQSDNCIAQGIRAWYSIWTVIDNQQYGATGGYASLSDFNIAGNVNTLFNLKTGKGFTVNNFYGEAFFTFGQVSCSFGSAIFTGCNFDFNQAIVSQPQFHLNGCINNIFIGCRFRYYDDLFNKRMRMYQPRNIQFIGGYMDKPPYIISEQANQNHSVSYQNVLVGQNVILGMTNDFYYYEAGATTIIPYGQFKIQNTVGQDTGSPVTPTIYYDYNVTTFNRSFGTIASGVTITPTSGRTATFTSTFNYLLYVDDICIDNATGNVLGRISNITGTTITISEIPINITTGSYTIMHVYYLTHLNMCIGDITNGDAHITNVCELNPGFLNTFANGFRYDHQAFPKGSYITNYNSSTNIITMSAAANKTAIRQNFLNGDPDVLIKSITAPNSVYLKSPNPSYPTPIPTDAVWIEEINSLTSSTSNPNKWLFNLGGYIDAAGLGLSSAYQADFNILPFRSRIFGGSYQYWDNTGGGWTNA